MKLHQILMLVAVISLFVLSATAVAAEDFAWTKDFNIKAEADPSGFRVSLATRFKIGDAEVRLVLSNVEKPADAYILLRLGEMSAQPIDYVIKKYKANKGKGWGVLARSLGIKPGSKEFHALKRGDDLYSTK